MKNCTENPAYFWEGHSNRLQGRLEFSNVNAGATIEFCTPRIWQISLTSADPARLPCGVPSSNKKRTAQFGSNNSPSRYRMTSRKKNDYAEHDLRAALKGRFVYHCANCAIIVTSQVYWTLWNSLPPRWRSESSSWVRRLRRFGPLPDRAGKTGPLANALSVT